MFSWELMERLALREGFEDKNGQGKQNIDINCSSVGKIELLKA